MDSAAPAEGKPASGSGEPGWEDQPRHQSATDAPVLRANGFEWPLDWLLEMAREERIDLARLPVAELIGAFATALEAALARGKAPSPAASAMSLGCWGEWLVMAATLAWLRSRLLLPATAPEARAAHHQAEALRQLLLERARMLAAADWLERRLQLGRDVFPRGTAKGVLVGRGGDLTELLRACLVALRLPAWVEFYQPRLPAVWRVTDAIARIRLLLNECAEGDDFARFLPEIAAGVPARDLQCRAAVASTLVAGLELARGGTITLGQAETWGSIRLRSAPAVTAPHAAGQISADVPQ